MTDRWSDATLQRIKKAIADVRNNPAVKMLIEEHGAKLIKVVVYESGTSENDQAVSEVGSASEEPGVPVERTDQDV